MGSRGNLLLHQKQNQLNQSPRLKTEPPTPKAPDISIHDADKDGNVEVVKQHLTAGADVNSKNDDGRTPLDFSIKFKNTEITDLLRKHGGNSKLKGNDYPK